MLRCVRCSRRAALLASLTVRILLLLILLLFEVVLVDVVIVERLCGTKKEERGERPVGKKEAGLRMSRGITSPSRDEFRNFLCQSLAIHLQFNNHSCLRVEVRLRSSKFVLLLLLRCGRLLLVFATLIGGATRIKLFSLEST